MSMSDETNLGRTLIICNPAAQSGAAAEVGEQLKRFLEMYLHDGSAFNCPYFTTPQHLQRYIHSSFDIVEIAIRIQQ